MGAHLKSDAPLGSPLSGGLRVVAGAFAEVAEAVGYGHVVDGVCAASVERDDVVELKGLGVSPVDVGAYVVAAEVASRPAHCEYGGA